MTELTGAFRALPGHLHTTPGGGLIPPQRPSLWLSVTMRAKLQAQGLFERRQAQITHHPDGVDSSPTPLTLVVGHDGS